MRPRVTLQLPAGPPDPPVILDGARILLFGHGYVARALERHLRAAGAIVEHTVREGGPLTLGASATRAVFREADAALVSIPPSRSGTDPSLEALRGTPTRARWIGYLSATSVYGDRQGRWAFEGEAPTPGLDRGVRRADAELRWLSAYPQTQIFRLAGIYGPGRSPFGRIWDGSARIIDAPGHVVNRIHVEDIVSALLASLARPSPQDLLNLADGHPAPPDTVMAHAARLIGEPVPNRVSLDDPSVSAMARSFYAESKRVDIGRAKARLGWEPRFASFETGLAATLKAERRSA